MMAVKLDVWYRGTVRPLSKPMEGNGNGVYYGEIRVKDGTTAKELLEATGASGLFNVRPWYALDPGEPLKDGSVELSFDEIVYARSNCANQSHRISSSLAKSRIEIFDHSQGQW